MISVKAMSENPMRGPVSISGRCPDVNCRTRLETTLTSNCWLGITLNASSRSWLVIERMSTAREKMECDFGGKSSTCQPVCRQKFSHYEQRWFVFPSDL